MRPTISAGNRQNRSTLLVSAANITSVKHYNESSVLTLGQTVTYEQRCIFLNGNEFQISFDHIKASLALKCIQQP